MLTWDHLEVLDLVFNAASLLSSFNHGQSCVIGLCSAEILASRKLLKEIRKNKKVSTLSESYFK